MKKYTIAVDFDGVIHSYVQPFIAKHVIPDPPVEGAIEWLHRMIQKFEVVIFTTRGSTWRGRRAVRAWLKKYAEGMWYEAPGYRGLEDVKVTDRKIAALVYIDDRAIRFDGMNFPNADDIHLARPWHKPSLFTK